MAKHNHRDSSIQGGIGQPSKLVLMNVKANRASHYHEPNTEVVICVGRDMTGSINPSDLSRIARDRDQ